MAKEKKKKYPNHFLKALKGNWGYTIATPLTMIGEVIMECLIPYIMAYLVDFLSIAQVYKASGVSLSEVTASFPSIEANRISLYVNMLNAGIPVLGIISICGALIVLSACVSLVFGIAGAHLGSRAAARFSYNLRKLIYENIQTLSFENLDKYQTSSLITRLTTDITNIQDAYLMMIRMFFRAPMMFIISIIMCCTIQAKLASVLCIAIPLLIIGLGLIMSKAHPYFEKLFHSYDSLNERLQENLIGIRVVKSFVREDFEIEKFRKTNHEMQQFGVKAENILAFNSPLMSGLMYLTICLVCFLGGKIFIVRDGSMTLGDLQAYITYITQILSSLMMLSMVFVMIVMSRASIERVNEILDEKTILKNKDNPVTEVASGSVTFDHVNFSYSHDMNKLNLEDASFTIDSGDIVGIIGGTGSSKTTLVSLISRLYDVTSGSVKVGNVDVRDYDMKVLRDKVSVVLQKNVLFSGSVRDNMKWGKEDATDEEIIAALKQAQAYEFVSNLPGGLDYDLGQGGVNVSGGQKQRLCIARALLKSPKILILDDSTSAVDTKTDALIRAAFRQNIPDVTKFIIAQRINSVEDADKIIVLNDGKIDAIGTHEELIRTNAIYREVYESQTKGDEE